MAHISTKSRSVGEKRQYEARVARADETMKKDRDASRDRAKKWQESQRNSPAKQANTEKVKPQTPGGAYAGTPVVARKPGQPRKKGKTEEPSYYTTRIIEGPDAMEVKFENAGQEQESASADKDSQPDDFTMRVIEGPDVREVRFEKERKKRKPALYGVSRIASEIKKRVK